MGASAFEEIDSQQDHGNHSGGGEAWGINRIKKHWLSLQKWQKNPGEVGEKKG